MPGRNLRARMAAALAIAVASSGGSSFAEEGLWTFDAFPSEAVRQSYGVDVDKPFLDRLRLGSGRLSSGCSAGFVSAEGLIQTNHHCVLDCIQQLTPSGVDPLVTPVLAPKLEDEQSCPGLTMDVLQEITDVSDEMAAATSGKEGEAFGSARDAARDAIEERCLAGEADRVCEVVSLYQGGQYKLYRYRTFDDLRMVLGVEGDVGSFGGDPDNFNFPRYALDVAFLRAWHDDRPVATPDHFRWRSDPIEEGELLFVAGSPGETSRLWTVERIAFVRDQTAPFWLTLWAELRGRLTVFATQGPEESRIASQALYDVENWFKGWLGERMAIVPPEVMADLAAREKELRRRIDADPKLAAATKGAFEALEQIEAEHSRTFYPFRLVEDGMWGNSDALDYGRTLLRAAEDAGRDDKGEWRAEPLEVDAWVTDEDRVEPRLDELRLGFWLSKVREYLTTDDPLVRRILGNESPEGLAARVVKDTKLGDAAMRRKLVDGGARAVMESDDPMLVFLRGFDSEARALDEHYAKVIVAGREREYGRIARARFALDGDRVYPDATGTPRVSYGTAAGWTEPTGRVVPYATRFEGLSRRATGAIPYKLAPLWEKALPSLDPKVILNVATTNDTVGGNSGSPVLDREGRVVGAMFDGNFASLGGTYFFDPEQNRSVIVAATAVEEALLRVYRLERIVAELHK